jgi:hypothetical protein
MERLTLSPAQGERLADLDGLYPATAFHVVAQDPYSCALTVETSDPLGEHEVTITANGLVRVHP